MKQKIVTLILTCTLLSSSLYAQEEFSSAYLESYHTAHWSAYIPITLMVAAAIWFGIADRRTEHHHHHPHDSRSYQGKCHH